MSLACIYFINQLGFIKPLTTKNEINYNYKIETGLENISKIIKPAIENYLIQDGSESRRDRNNRLSLYFSADSPVYNSQLENLNMQITKSNSKIKSINNSEAESEDQSYIVEVETTQYSDKKEIKKIQSYWIMLTKIYDNSVIPYSIGVIE